MIKIHEQEMPQGSPEWLNWRKKGIGGSEIASVMNESKYKTRYQLWLEKTGAVEPEDLSNNFAVNRGKTLEPIAREIINEQLKKNFVPCLFQGDAEYMKYSSDGHDEASNELLEIKCLGEKNHQIVIDTKEVLPVYKAQCQWALLITGAPKIYFCSYNQSYPDPVTTVEVLPDLEYQNKLILEAAEFWQLVEKKVMPELTEDDFLDVSCEAFFLLKTQYQEALEKHKDAENRLNTIKEKIKAFADGRNIKANGLKVFSSVRRGSIDYSKIPELADVDLEQYRKPDSKIFYIK